MSTWECGECTAAYAPGAPRCPHCGTNRPIKEAEQLAKEREEMAKITVHGGPSNEDAEPGQPGYVEPVEVEEPAAGADAAEEVTEAPEPVDYNEFTVTDLRAELAERGLTVSGSKPELVDRLIDDDTARADKAEQDSAE